MAQNNKKINLLENDKEYQLKTKRMESHSLIKVIAMIMLTILGGITMIGLFWGKEGITNFGIGILITTVAGILLISTFFSDYHNNCDRW